MSEHRWSGWPGAWCLDCGVGDAGEVCIASSHDGRPDGLTCVEGHGCCDLGHEVPPCTIPEHRNNPCPEPGSKRNDPYAALAQNGAA